MTELREAGFKILKSDAAFVKMNFTDVGAIVYYATVIPWEFPDFDVKKVMPQLHQLQKIIDSQGSVTTFEDRFIVFSKKELIGIKLDRNRNILVTLFKRNE